jgi:hypothetical protein
MNKYSIRHKQAHGNRIKPHRTLAQERCLAMHTHISQRLIRTLHAPPNLTALDMRITQNWILPKASKATKFTVVIVVFLHSIK